MEIFIGIVVGIVALGLLLVSIGNSIGAPDPETMSEAAIYQRLGTENAWILKYLDQPISKRQSDPLKRMYNEKNNYMQRLVAELNKRNAPHTQGVISDASIRQALTKKEEINTHVSQFDQSSETTLSSENIADAISSGVGQNSQSAHAVADGAFDPAQMQMTAYQLGTMYFHALKEKNKFGLLLASKFEVNDDLSEAWLDSYPPEQRISMADAAIALREGLAYHERKRRERLVQIHRRMTFDLAGLTSKTGSEAESIHREYLQDVKSILGKEPEPSDLSDIANITPLNRAQSNEE